MLSKEEIEKIKKTLQEYDHYYSDHATDENEDIIDEGAEELANIFNNAWYYIEQLETDKQKLIEKLEECKYIKIPGIKEIMEEILEFAKGEK